MKRILSIQDLSCAGRCSLTVAMPVLSAMGLQCIPLPTAVLSTHTAFAAPHIRPLTQDLLPVCRHWQSIGLSFDAISVGYLADPQQVAAIEAVFEAFSATRIVDPVLGDHGKLYSGITAEHIQAMKQLCSKAHVLLPNITEAAFLTGNAYQPSADLAYYRALAADMLCFGAEHVVLTGVSASEGQTGFLTLSRDGSEHLYQTNIIARQLHGTGDLFCAVFSGALAHGLCVFDAAKLAAGFIEQVLSETHGDPRLGAQFEPLLPSLWARLNSSKA